MVVAERPEDMAYESGGAGLWSTVDDYLKFARLFLRWRRGGWRASPASGNARDDGCAISSPTASVRTPVARAETLRGGSGIWARCLGGAGDRQIRLDAARQPRERSVGPVRGEHGGRPILEDGSGMLIFLAHDMVDLAQMAKGIGLGVWGAVDR